MGNSYTRQAGSNIANGNIIDATDLNSEFDTLDAAFNSSTGHTHDGSGNGAPIVKTGPGLEFVFNAGNVTPKTSGTDLDIGTASLKFNNANFKGTVTAPTFTATSGATIPSLTVGTSTAVTSVDADLSSVSGNHDTLASSKAIKTYIDNQVTAQDLDITDGTTTGSIDLDSQSLTFTGSTGITATVSNQTVTISTTDSEIVHDSLSGFVAAEHVDHSGVTITAGNGLTGGGTIESTRTLTVDPHTGITVTTDGVALSHLGLEDLADPDADRVAFWDDSAGAFKWLEMGSNLAITDTTLNATDTDTTYSAGTGLTLSGTTFNANVDATIQTTGAETVTSTASRTYAVQVDSSDTLVVNVPWVDTDTDTDTTYAAGTGLTLDGTTFNANVDATTQTVASETVSATASRTYAVQVDSSDNLVVNVPWSTSASSPASYTIDAVDNIILDSNDTQYFKSGGTDVDFGEPMFYFQGNTPASNGNYPVNLRLYNNSPNPADNRDLGSISWYMDNSADYHRAFVWMDAKATDYTEGSMDGELKINIRSSNATLTVFEAEGGAVGGDTYIRSADDIYLRQGGNDIYFGDATNANEAQIRFELAPYATELAKIHCSDPLYIQPTGKLNLSPTTGETVFLGPDSNTPIDIEIRRSDQSPTNGDVIGKIRFTAEDSADSFTDYVTLEASIGNIGPGVDSVFKINTYTNGYADSVFEATDAGHTLVKAPNDVYIRPMSNDVFFQAYNPSPITPDPGRQVQISLQEFYQGIYASDSLIIKSGINSNGAAYEYMRLESGDKFIFESATGTAELKNSSATQALLDWNTTNTLKIYTGSSTLNSTFSGSGLTVEGALSKGSGSFKIDHPLPAKTETHHLVHSFIEGPQADLIYRGRAELVGGTATVNIDTAAGMTEGTFVVLCGDVQCFTSNESGWTAVKGSVSGNTLTIIAQDNTCTDTISWMVVGERKDQHMIDTDWTDSEGHVIVEPEKTV